MYPRFLITLDEELNPLPVSVRVGKAVDVVGQAGKPRTISGFQVSPSLLSLSQSSGCKSLPTYSSLLVFLSTPFFCRLTLLRFVLELTIVQNWLPKNTFHTLMVSRPVVLNDSELVLAGKLAFLLY